MAGNGVVTLSGSVSSEAERSAIAGDAASVNGVRTVVNNSPCSRRMLQTAAQSAAASEPPSPSPAQPSAPLPTIHSGRPSAARQSGSRRAAGNVPLTQADAMAQQRNSPAAQNRRLRHRLRLSPHLCLHRLRRELPSPMAPYSRFACWTRSIPRRQIPVTLSGQRSIHRSRWTEESSSPPTRMSSDAWSMLKPRDASKGRGCSPLSSPM